MLITFNSKSHNDVTMFGNIAESLISMMAFTTDVPGAIRAEDVAMALANLESNLARVKQSSILNQEAQQSIDINDDDNDDDDIEPEINISVRAMPLIALLKSAVASKNYVMWQ